jgi:clan AA aspartic protease
MEAVKMERKGKMGRFSVEILVTNNHDVHSAADGTLSADQVRSVRIQGVVDSGAADLVLPKSVVKQLGLQEAGTAKVRYADHRTATRAIVEEARVEILGRHGTFRALVEPARDTALIGAIVLEVLDLVVDCRTKKLRKRDPRWVLSEIE